ncbi:M1 family metallopeptidase, partial [candidate division KSB1 bacterium]|nr:M1 family metallopeptidase [candidate division KSB1 bacterium]NIR73193.1 M1 family metallopeptidase [candidate division KSB1 bacterium]NIS28342.1 M1 family metallopeptidase [candidate division KSB1 bacterium]NIT75234.1 M1 family metallopeptidase [candidate division KSB1 bacterium]NIU29074.1 M1 family metallopeptidase [candidate division KSB1 bacterium]
MCKQMLSPKALLFAPMLLFGNSLIAQDVPTLFPNPLSPRIANYNIEVKLDPDTRLLDGSEVLIWHNKTNDTITELRFHMYLNAFRNSKSTFMRESGGLSRGHKIDKDGWGFNDVNRLTVAYGTDLRSSIEYIHPSDAPEVMGNPTDLTDRLQYIQPDDGNEHDKTVFRVPLPKPLPRGEFVAVNIDFTAKLPSPPFARTGAKKEYFFVGQWFPKIGVYTDKGWNCHQFHANSEFFADFGVYNVRITVPEENVVGATGIEVEVRNNDDGTATHFYHAEDVHDFAWTTSPEFLEFTDKAQDVDVRLLIQPDHANQSQRHLDAARVGVQHFQDWYGDYPFPNLTVVDPRRGAGGSGGMEYPTLITAGTRYGLPKGLRAVEGVIVHEFGHNYWYHLLASNEFEEAWLDEGINSYTDTQIMNDAYGPKGDLIDFMGIKINELQVHRSGYLSHSELDPIIKKAWEFYSGNSYGISSYSKPAIVLNTLRNYLGTDLMRKVMRT